MLTFITHTEKETLELGRKIGEKLEPGSIVLLKGDLGSGKTVLARGIARGLGIKEPVVSPTYTLLHQYHGRLPLYHFDIYRLDSPEDMYDLDYEEFFYNDGVTVVEWPEKMEGLYPDEYIEINIELLDRPQERKITVTFVGEKYSKMEGEISNYEGTGG